MLVRIAAETDLPACSGSDRRLLAEGATVPFIARYRKEAAGSLDEVAITTIRDRLSSWLNSNPGDRPSSNLWENVNYSVMPPVASCRLRPRWLWKMRLLPSDPSTNPATMARKKVLSPWPIGCRSPGCISSGARGSGSGLSLVQSRKKTGPCRIRQPPGRCQRHHGRMGQ